jgi:MOSC domain-containing protein YiiM
MEELEQVAVMEDFGFEGCAHARPGNRQILLVDLETLDELSLSPGIIRENITTEGLNVNGLETGERLQVGKVLLEITVPCTPCGLMDLVRPGLRREIRGRRGMLCRVVEGGILRRGDGIVRSA